MSTDTEIGISANVQPFTREMERAAMAAMSSGQRIQSALRDAGANIAKTLTESLDKINDKAKANIALMEHYKGAIAAVGTMVGAFAGVALGAKKLADETYASTHAAELLGSKLGISAAQAGVLAIALDNINSDSGTLEAGLNKVTKTLSDNEEAFKKLGVETRDSNGNFRSSLDIMTEANARFLQFREGTDRNIEMQRIYGKSWQDMVPLLNLTAEAMAETQAKSEALGLVLGQENVESAHAYDDALDDVGMVLKGLGKAIGDALMPVIAKLGEWFMSIGPSAILVTKGAVGGLTAAFWILKNGVVAVWEILNAVVTTFAEPIRAIAESIYRLGQGDFTGARTAVQNIGKNIGAAWKTTMAEIEKSSSETRDKVWDLFATPTALATKNGGGEGATPDTPKKGKTAGTKGKTVSEAEWAMEEAAHLARTYHQIGEERAAAEQASFDRAKEFAEDWEADLDRANQGVAADAKKTAEQRVQVEYAWSQNAAAARLAVVDADQAQARYAVEIGSMTKEELLAQEIQFEQRRNEIRQQALQDRLALIDPEKDPVAYAQTLIALEELERQHQQAVTAIKQQAALEQTAPMRNAMQGIETSMAQSMQKLMQGQMSLAGFMKSLWNGVVSAIVGEIAKMAAAWIMNKVKMLVFGKATALSEISTLAARAGAGGVASWAASPWPINMGAPAFGAAMSAAAMAFAPVAAASGGYDIPAGINPITQLHAQEMVLPSRIAEPLRQSLDGGGIGGGDVHLHVSAVDGASVRRMFMDHGPALADALKAQVRGFRT